MFFYLELNFSYGVCSKFWFDMRLFSIIRRHIFKSFTGGPGQRKLPLVSMGKDGYSAEYLRTKAGGSNSCIFIVPIQDELDTSQLAPDSLHSVFITLFSYRWTYQHAELWQVTGCRLLSWYDRKLHSRLWKFSTYYNFHYVIPLKNSQEQNLMIQDWMGRT